MCRNKNEKNIKKLYKQMNVAASGEMFYGDEKNACFIVPQIAEIIYGAKKNYSEAELSVCLSLYVDVWIRKHHGLSQEYTTVKYIKDVLPQKYNFTHVETICCAIDIAVNFIYQHEPDMKEKDNYCGYVNEFVNKNTDKNVGMKSMYINDPQYGLCPEKPVFVNGSGEDKIYLQHLETSDGKPVRFCREGSIGVNGISGKVDIYTLYCEDKLYSQIFLCNQGNITSTVAPRGLKYTPHISHAFGPTPTQGGVYSELHYYDASGNHCDSKSAVRSVGYEFDAAGKVINQIHFIKR